MSRFIIVLLGISLSSSAFARIENPAITAAKAAKKKETAAVIKEVQSAPWKVSDECESMSSDGMKWRGYLVTLRPYLANSISYWVDLRTMDPEAGFIVDSVEESINPHPCGHQKPGPTDN